MNRRSVSTSLLLSVLVLLAAPVNAKGPVVKLVVSGPDLRAPIEVTDPEAINADIYGANFIDRQRGPHEPNVGGPVSPYQIQFYVDLPRQEGVQMMYVVYF